MSNYPELILEKAIPEANSERYATQSTTKMILEVIRDCFAIQRLQKDIGKLDLRKSADKSTYYQRLDEIKAILQKYGIET